LQVEPDLARSRAQTLPPRPAYGISATACAAGPPIGARTAPCCR